MQIRILGIGMGPQHVTVEVAQAIATLDYVVASEKESGNGRLTLRHKIVETYPGPNGPIPIIAIPDPPQHHIQSRPLENTHNNTWRHRRAIRYAEILAEREGTAGFLVWGDPALYDSTIHLVHELQTLGLDINYDVLPGISAPQLLAARHKILLHDIGHPVYITTPGDLQHAIGQGNTTIIVMLNSPLNHIDLTGLEDWTVYWGANLGSPGEQLIAGQLSCVLSNIFAQRVIAEKYDGWVLDIMLLRAPQTITHS